jgi:uncharacterized protein (TIGR01777 family)
MKILITGGTGFIGSFLVPQLLENGHQVSILTRSDKKSKQANLQYLQWDGTQMPLGIGLYDAIINLAGANIGKLAWTEENKKIIRSSRIDATKACVNYINQSPNPPSVFISGSAVGIYGEFPKEVVSEEDPAGDYFLGELAEEWEAEAKKAKCRTVISRTGVVLGEGSEITERLKPLYKLFLGGKIANGKQGFPWVHVEDVVGIFNFFLENDEAKGPYNVAGPQIIDQATFSHAFADSLNVPDFWTIPKFAMSLMFGSEKSVIFWGGQKVSTKKLQKEGYNFKYPTVEQALEEIF